MSSSAEFIGVPKAKLADVWPHVEGMIQTACARNNGRFDHLDVLRWLLSADWQLWVAVADEKIIACCCTEIVSYPKSTWCAIRIGTGTERRLWQGFRHDIEQWALSQGCKGVEGIMRTGWARIFTGYTSNHKFMERAL